MANTSLSGTEMPESFFFFFGSETLGSYHAIRVKQKTKNDFTGPKLAFLGYEPRFVAGACLSFNNWSGLVILFCPLHVLSYSNGSSSKSKKVGKAHDMS